MTNSPSAPSARWSPKKAAVYACLRNPGDFSLLFDNAEQVLHTYKSETVLDYLFQRSRLEVPYAEWKTEVRRSTTIANIMKDFFGFEPPAGFENIISSAARQDAIGRMTSARGTLALTFHCGYTTLMRHFYYTFLASGFWIEKAKLNSKSIAVKSDPAAALFAALRALRQGHSVCMAPDGPFGQPTGHIQPLGVSCPVADGASFLAYESQCNTVWYMLRRSGQTFVPVVEAGPTRQPEEPFPTFRQRLLSFYEAKITEFLTGEPQDLALGGTWRNLLLEVIRNRVCESPRD